MTRLDALYGYNSTRFFIGLAAGLIEMSMTKTSLKHRLCTSLMAACLLLCTMLDTNSSFLCVVGASFMTAGLYFGTMSFTNSSLKSLVCTSFMATFLYFGTMLNTDSFFLSLVCTSFITANLSLLHNRSMLDTNSSLLSFVCASFLAAMFISPMSTTLTTISCHAVTTLNRTCVIWSDF